MLYKLRTFITKVPLLCNLKHDSPPVDKPLIESGLQYMLACWACVLSSVGIDLLVLTGLALKIQIEVSTPMSLHKVL